MESEPNVENENKESNVTENIMETPTPTDNIDKILKSVYGNIYEQTKDTFRKMEDKTKNYFNSIIKDLDKKYEEFNSNIHKYLLKATTRFTKVFKLDENIDEEKANLIQNYTKENLDQLIKIVNMQDQILQSIQETIDILISTFDISKFLDKEKPVQYFLEKEFEKIINSWLFIKLDIEKFNFAKSINNSNLNSNFKEFIYKACQDKNFIMNIGPAEILIDELNEFKYDDVKKDDIIMISNNANNLARLKINKVDYTEYCFKDVKNFPKLNYLKLNNVSFQDKNKFSIFKKCPNLEKLVINGVNNFEIKMLEDLSKNITKLIFSNNNFINYDFQTIMTSYIIKSDSMRRNLLLLSFSNNCITSVDLESLVRSKQRFYSLKELDFHKNRINKFTINPEFFPELKTINCCYNKFSSSSFKGYTDILTLLSGNLFLTNLNICKNYYGKLSKQLNEYKISLTYLSLSYLPSNFCDKYLSNIIINDNILISLKKIDLSYNNLTCDTLFNFFNNNKGCLYLRKLNLCGNKLDDTFFERYLNLKLYNIFARLQKINLNDNLIGGPNKINIIDLGEEPKIIKEENKMDVYKLRLIYKFIVANKNLSKLSISKNPMNSKSVISTDIDMSNVSKLMQKDNSNHYIINDFYSFVVKIITELLKNNDEKVNRGHFNLKFDIGDTININSENFRYQEKFIMFN
jgi:hypothetical protein